MPPTVPRIAPSKKGLIPKRLTIEKTRTSTPQFDALLGRLWLIIAQMITMISEMMPSATKA